VSWHKSVKQSGKAASKQYRNFNWSSGLGFGLFIGLLIALGGCESESSSSSTSADSGSTPSRLDEVRNRGQLACGVSGELPGFSFVRADGSYAGLDVDICRAIAAAIFDDPEAVEYRNLNAKERFTAVQTGEVDVLSRNTTWILSRETTVRMVFGPVVFYDGQGVMVRKQSNLTNLSQFKNVSICIQTGTTHEQNLTDQIRKQGLTYRPLVFEDVNSMFAAYSQNRCQVITADRSALLARRTKLPQPDEHQILDVVLSKEPLAPAVAAGDERWAAIMRWVIYALFEAEELGITSQNIAEQTKSSNPVIKRFLGTEGELGQGLGLTNDFVGRIIKHVGNYSEVYNRSLGSGTPLNLPRGQNHLWTNGGLMYAPPFR
jgi:general L-amino acid transport system substrate-binding protein